MFKNVLVPVDGSETSELNELLAQIREGGHTVSDRGRRLKIQYATQTGSKPPVISFWCNAPDLVDDNYERESAGRTRRRVLGAAAAVIAALIVASVVGSFTYPGLSFSRSYGYILPSSLTRGFPRTLEFSS